MSNNLLTLLASARIRNHMIPLRSNELLIQLFHITHHLFQSTLNNRHLRIRLSQEREAFAHQREAQFRLYIHHLGSDIQMTLMSAPNLNGPTIPMGANLPGSSSQIFPFPLPTKKILCWNCRGTRRAEFLTAARDLIQRYRPHLFIVIDTHLHDDRAPAIG